jgi:putative oxidoreductase
MNPVVSYLFNQKILNMKQQNIHFGLLILRFTLGALMLFHGYAKIMNGVEGIGNTLVDKGLPAFIAYGVYVGEVIAPLMMIVGFRARLAAILFSINMVVAAVLAHPDDIFALTERGVYALETLALFLFGGLALVFTGGGKFSVSAKSWWD